MKNKKEQNKKRLRISVFRSNKHVYVQLIDGENGKTLLGVSEKNLGEKSGKKTEIGKKLGMLLAEKAKGKNIKQVIFDKRGYAYHGVVKQIAEGAREGGLEF